MDVPTTEFAVADAKARFSDLIARAEHGEEITIKRHGRAVAKLVPIGRVKPTLAERLRAHRAWIDYRASHDITLGPDLTLKDLIDEGRR